MELSTNSSQSRTPDPVIEPCSISLGGTYICNGGVSACAPSEHTLWIGSGFMLMRSA